MAGGYESELHHYQEVIDGKADASPDVLAWLAVRLPFRGWPTFLATLTSPQHKLFCIVELHTYMGEGKVRIPVGLYGDRPHEADNAIVSYNRISLSLHDDQGMRETLGKLGLPWDWPVDDITCTSAGGYEIFFTPGYELILSRSLDGVGRGLLVMLPENDKLLHGVSADGLTRHITEALPLIHIQPIGPEELQLQAPS